MTTYNSGTIVNVDTTGSNTFVCSIRVYSTNVGYAQSGHNTSGRESPYARRGNRGSLASVGKPTSATLASLAGLLSNSDIKTEAKSETSFSSKVEKEEVYQRVRVSVTTIYIINQFCISTFRIK